MFTDSEALQIRTFQKGHKPFDRMSPTLQQKLIDHFVASGEMPHDVVRSQSEEPQFWLLDHFKRLGTHKFNMWLLRNSVLKKPSFKQYYDQIATA